MPGCSHAYGECDMKIRFFVDSLYVVSQRLCMLQAWGVRKITLLDNGRVAMSNPLRQSLYTLDDCLDGGDFKALAAAKSLKRIFPAVVINFTFNSYVHKA